MAGVLMNSASNDTKLRQSGSERNANMDGSAAGVSNVEGPRYANMGVSAADVRRRFMNTGTNEEGNSLIGYQSYWLCQQVDSVVCIRTVSSCRTVLARAAICITSKTPPYWA